MQLSEHFTLAEMCNSQAAIRNRLDNRPGDAEIENLKRVAAILEQVRELVGKPINVSSGYRSPAVNRAVGGSSASAHMKGLAADITVSGMTAKALATLISMSKIEFDQLILEGNSWVHIGLSENKPRKQLLTATFSHGGVTYSNGIV